MIDPVGNIPEDITGGRTSWNIVPSIDNEVKDTEGEPLCNDCHYLWLDDDRLMETDDDFKYKLRDLIRGEYGEKVSLKDAINNYFTDHDASIFKFKFGEYQYLTDNETKKYLKKLQKE